MAQLLPYCCYPTVMSSIKTSYWTIQTIRCWSFGTPLIVYILVIRWWYFHRRLILLPDLLRLSTKQHIYYCS
jgi:hypothetical protein